MKHLGWAKPLTWILGGVGQISRKTSFCPKGPDGGKGACAAHSKCGYMGNEIIHIVALYLGCVKAIIKEVQL